MTYREARKRAGLTLEAVAEQLGVTKAAISLWETGKGNPRLKNLKKLANLYGMSIADFAEEAK